MKNVIKRRGQCSCSFDLHSIEETSAIPFFLSPAVEPKLRAGNLNVTAARSIPGCWISLSPRLVIFALSILGVLVRFVRGFIVVIN